MASTNKTPKLGLNQWEPGDSVLREDFNGDNGKLDAAVAAAPGLAHTYGQYHGNGTVGTPISVNVGFHPSIVIVYWDEGAVFYHSAMFFKGDGINIEGKYPLAITTDTGFTVAHFVEGSNRMPLRPPLCDNRKYFYIAFR